MKWADAVERAVPLRCLDKEGAQKVKLQNTDDIISHPDMWVENARPDAFDISRGAGGLLTTPSVCELADMPGSGTTGQTRTDRHQSRRPYELPDWTANKKQALVKQRPARVRRVRYKTFQCLLDI